MKKCPQCQNIFDDSLNFCLNDGTTLEIIFTEDDTPTQFIPANFVNFQAKKSSNSGIHLIIGSMSALIIGLAVFITYLLFIDNPLNEKETGEKQIPYTFIENKNLQDGESNENITDEEVRSLVYKWKQSQETKDFAGYKNCYGQSFTGIKRTAKSSSTYNYNSWMKDRSQMIAKASDLSIEIRDLQISIEKDIATVNFDQIYRSVSYSDRGPKILKIKKIKEGEKIIYEELKYSLPLK